MACGAHQTNIAFANQLLDKHPAAAVRQWVVSCGRAVDPMVFETLFGQAFKPSLSNLIMLPARHIGP